MINLDNAATTPPDEEALKRAQAFASENFWNPSARYGGGFTVSGALDRARETLLTSIADPAKYALIFTSCGTESDNHAIFSTARRGNAVTTAGEHAAVYESFVELKNRGVEPRFTPIKRDGSVDAEALLSLVDENTRLVSVVHVNNETGAVNDIETLARLVKEKAPRCIFHSDGVQAYGKLPVRLKEVDLYSVSAHKLGGLKGTGGLFKKKQLPLSPFVCGGGQEQGLRSGTENVLGILCFAGAAEKKFRSLNQNFGKIRELNARFWQILEESGLFERISPENGSPYILTVAARGVRGEVVQRMLWDRGVVVGTGSACSSRKPYSRVIAACGYQKELLNGVLRVSFSAETQPSEIEEGARRMAEAVREFKGKV